jgi:hypothetical protein
MFDSDKFENAINDGRYIDAVNETLNASPDDDKEELRGRLFGKGRLFEKALRQAIVAENSSWIVGLNRQFPDWWTFPSRWGSASDPSYDYYKNYRSRFIKTQLKAAWIVANKEENNVTSLANNIDFPPGILHDFVALFSSNQLSSLEGLNVIKVPVLLVDEKEGYVASLFLEKVDIEGVDSPPYPHPVKMSGIPIDKRFEKAVEDAFHFLRGYLSEKIPVFRWWVEPLSRSKKIKGIKGPSLYGAFVVGMYSSTLGREICDDLTITCSGDLSGKIFGIDGLAQKYQAATKENLKIVVSGKQDYEDNFLTDEQKKRLLVADTAADVFEHFTKKDIIEPVIDTFLDITDLKSFIYKLVAVVAGIGGLGILFALLTYDPLINAIKDSGLKPEQVTLLYISIIASVFFIVVLAIYAGLKEKVLGFIFLVVIILSFMGAVIYWFNSPDVSYQKPDVPTNDKTTDCANVSEIQPIECEALVALYNSTDGANWSKNTNWNVTNTPCDWYGVSCKDGHVTFIDLHSNELSGSIPSKLGNLSKLTILTLGNNSLSGEIPSELGNLSRLTVLYLSENRLSGEIPSELGNLSRLTVLYLSENRLSGEIPRELGNLSNLTILNLGNNSLSGEIPRELGNLSNLASLYLDHNSLSGEIPSELRNLSRLTELGLDVEAGPIRNDDHAKQVCPGVCEKYGGWNEYWTTTVEGKMSVCGCNQSVSDGKPQCFWMEIYSGKFKWVPADTIHHRMLTKQECFERDSCDGGLGRPGGGCYKWATSPDAPRIKWKNGQK